ncbi:MAG: methyl-accepting chemotaxis protein, partial [Bacteroidota bacterium]
MNWFNNQTIAKKLMMTFGFLSLIALTIGYLGYTGITRVNANQEEMYQDCLSMTTDFGNVNGGLLTLRGNLLAALNSPTKELKEKYLLSVNDLTNEIDNISVKISNEALDEQEAKEFGVFSENWKLYKSIVGRAAENIRNGKNAEALNLIYGDGLQPITNSRNSLKELIKTEAKISERLFQRSEQEVADSLRNMMLILFAGIGSTIMIGMFIVRSITKPVKEVITNIENADLNSQFNSNRKDEVGELQRSFDGFVTSIKQTLIQVSEASAAVASASTQISSSTEELAAGAQEQSSQATEVAGAVEEMTKTIME